MSAGYRQHGFEPNAYEQSGKPLRPFNKVQWTGVAVGGAGIVLSTLDLLGEIGLVPQWVDSPPAFLLLLVALALINSRREPSTLAGAEQLDRNKLLLITVAVLSAILGAALILQFTGAN